MTFYAKLYCPTCRKTTRHKIGERTICLEHKILNENCPNCKNKDTYHHDTEDVDLIICPICSTEFYATEEFYEQNKEMKK